MIEHYGNSLTSVHSGLAPMIEHYGNIQNVCKEYRKHHDTLMSINKKITYVQQLLIREQRSTDFKVLIMCIYLIHFSSTLL